MTERHAAQGVLFYASLYINAILLAVGVITGRGIFFLMIFLTIGLLAYMMYLMSSSVDHLKSVGKWVDEQFEKVIQRVRDWYS